MSVFSKIKDAILGNNSTSATDGEVISAQGLIDQVFEHFKYRLVDSSTTMSLLFPTSFLIWLHPDDFKAREQEFPTRAKDIKKQCMIEVRNQIKSHPLWQDYVPHSKYWKIQFMEWNPDYVTADGKSGSNVVVRGRVTVTSDLYAQDDVASPANAVIAGSCNSSGRIITTFSNTKGTTTPQNLALNPEAFKDVTALSQNAFRVEFLRSELSDAIPRPTQQSAPQPAPHQTPQPAPQPEPARPSRGFVARDRKKEPVSATLQIYDSYFVKDGQKTDRLTIGTKSVQITGPNANGGNPDIDVIRIDDDSIMNPHINIRFEAANQRYLISAVGDTKLNQKRMVKDENNWLELPTNSTILLNDYIQINFNLNYA